MRVETVFALGLASGLAVFGIVAGAGSAEGSAAALDALGPGYFFETRLLARGPVENGILHGDLAVVGGGDPGISWRPYPWPDDPFGVFRRWAAALEQAGVRKVEGDVLLVHGRFPRPWVHPGWKEENRLKWYQVPVAALSGYVRGRSGRLYAFSVLVNGGAVWRARDLQDAIVRAVVDRG